MSRAHLILCVVVAACSDYELASKEDGTHLADTGAPALVVSPAAIDFGPLVPGETSGAELVTVSNVGDEDLTLLDLALDDATGAFTLGTISSVLLPPDGSSEFSVTYAPGWSTLDAFSGTVTVTSDAPSDGIASVSLIGTTPLPHLVLEPAWHDFGTLVVGGTDSVDLTLSNEGEAPATVASLSFASSSESELYVADWGELLVPPLTLGPGESTGLSVAFTPEDSGPEEGTLIVRSDDPLHGELAATIEGTGEETDPPCEETRQVTIFLTADDAWEGWIDGVEIPATNGSTWSSFDRYTTTLDCGDHAIAIYATDTAMVIAGFISVVYIEDEPAVLTGEGRWRMTDALPDATFMEVGFDDSGWTVPVPCSSTSPWGSTPSPFYAEGARWVWWTSSCTDLGEAWFRLEFRVE